MPDDTPLLSLPLILPNQAQKHVTHNEALHRLDLLVQLTVLDRDRDTPPALPAEGDCHIVQTGTGDWTGQNGMLAAWQAGAWTFVTPRAGWSVWVVTENRRLVWIGGQWSDGAELPGQMAQLAGLMNQVADISRLSA